MNIEITYLALLSLLLGNPIAMKAYSQEQAQQALLALQKQVSILLLVLRN